MRVGSVCVLWVTHFTSTLLRLLTKMPQRAKHEAASGVSNATNCTLALIRVLITHVQHGAADLWAFVIAARYISPGKQSTMGFSHRKKNKTKCQHHSFHFAEKTHSTVDIKWTGWQASEILGSLCPLKLLQIECNTTSVKRRATQSPDAPSAALYDCHLVVLILSFSGSQRS